MCREVSAPACNAQSGITQRIRIEAILILFLFVFIPTSLLSFSDRPVKIESGDGSGEGGKMGMKMKVMMKRMVGDERLAQLVDQFCLRHFISKALTNSAGSSGVAP